MPELTSSYLKSIMSYDPETGVFNWISPRPKINVGDRVGYLKKNKGYMATEIDGKFHSLHRLAWLYTYGEWPADQIDHINRDRSDNRIANLREANNSQNQHNSTTRNKTGFPGVSFHSWLKEKPYEAKISAKVGEKRKVFTLGCYPTPQEAYEVYRRAKNCLAGGYSVFFGRR